MINPEIKDRLLKILVERTHTTTFFSGDYSDLSNELGIGEDHIREIIVQFSKRGLVRNLKTHQQGFAATVAADAYDLFLLGGYTGEVETMGLEFRKLQVEILKLEQDLSRDKFDKITQGMSALAGLYSAMISRIGT